MHCLTLGFLGLSPRLLRNPCLVWPVPVFFGFACRCLRRVLAFLSCFFPLLCPASRSSRFPCVDGLDSAFLWSTTSALAYRCLFGLLLVFWGTAGCFGFPPHPVDVRLFSACFACFALLPTLGLSSHELRLPLAHRAFFCRTTNPFLATCALKRVDLPYLCLVIA